MGNHAAPAVRVADNAPPLPPAINHQPAKIAMEINTSRFGAVEIAPEDILLFPRGLAGFEECRHWILLADGENEAVAWLQSISRPDLALAVVSPRRFAPHYQVRVAKSELAALELALHEQAYVLCVLSKNDGRLTLNLKAPLIINLDQRLGRQVVTTDEQPLQFELPGQAQLRKSA